MKIGEILDYSIEVYKKNFKHIIIISLMFFLPYILASLLIVPIALPFLDKEYLFPSTILDIKGNNNLILGEIITVSIMLYIIIFKPIFDAAMIKLIYQNVIYQKITSIKNLCSNLFKSSPKLVLNRIFYYLIILLTIFTILCALLIECIFISNIFVAKTSISQTTALLISILLVTLNFPLILTMFYSIIRYGFSTHSICLENKDAAKALKRSFELTNQSFENIFYTYIIGFFCYSLVSSLIIIFSNIPIYQYKFEFIVIYSVIKLLAVIVFVLFYAFANVLGTMIFINQKIIKDGLDMELVINELIDKN